MKREDEYRVYPSESAYGAIQVKSRLTKAELKNAFENIASYKRSTQGPRSSSTSDRTSAITFVYATDLKPAKLCDDIKNLAALHTKEVLPNLIVVLGKGLFFFGDGNSGKLQNTDIETIQDLKVFSSPNRQQCLYGFYTTLMELLRSGEAPPTPVERYFQLPTTVFKYSYDFAYASFRNLEIAPSMTAI